MSNNTYVQDTPTTENSNTNIPWPWDPNNPSGPYSTVYTYNFSVTPAVPEEITVSHNPWIVKVYTGPTTVSAAEITLLQAAGYSGDIV